MTTSTEPAFYVDQAGQKHEIPCEAIELRLAWLAADREHSEACDALTRREVALRADPEADVDDSMRARLVDAMLTARGVLEDVTQQVYENPWRRTMDSWYAADQAVRKAAAAELERLAADVRDLATPPAARPA